MAGTIAPFASRAVRATKGSTSLRVTIPQVVASTLGLRPGDTLLWVVDPHSGQVRVEAQREIGREGEVPEESPQTS